MDDPTSRAIQPARGGLAGAILSYRPRQQPKTTVALGLWFLGLLLVFVVRAPPPTKQQIAASEAKLHEAEAVARELSLASRQLIELEVDLQNSKGWFWRFSQQQRQAVASRMPAVREARRQVDELRRQRDAKVQEAKSELGLWSEAGLEESRELFWESFNQGKVFAQRQSIWDAAFTIMFSREKDWLWLLIRLLAQTLLNFTSGLLLSLFFFLARLPSMLWSFGAAWWSALPFLALAMVGAISVVVSYLGLLYGAGAAVVYTSLRVAVHREEQLLSEGQARRRRISYRHHED